MSEKSLRQNMYETENKIHGYVCIYINSEHEPWHLENKTTTKCSLGPCDILKYLTLQVMSCI